MTSSSSVSTDELANRRCKACEGDVDPMDDDQVRENLENLSGWDPSGDGIEKTFEFDDFYRTVAFVNAVAWIANSEDHHPDLCVSYDTCKVFFSTHAIGGLSENDFICAAKIERLF